MKIRTEFVYPPVPFRDCDWSAVDYDNYEPGCPIGRGRTEQEAIEDLQQQIEDSHEPTETPENVEEAAPRAQALEEVAQGKGGAAAPGAQHGPYDGRAELSDEFFDDDKSEDEEQYLEPDPQTGFYSRESW
jgi:hypothetical protein